MLAALTVVLLLAAVTRILHINEQALWIDEGATYFILQQPDLIRALELRDHHPPGYYLLLQAWLALTGETALSMRMFSALFSILSVAAVVPLTRALHRGDARFSAASVPILAALLLTLSDPEVVLAQDARMYALRTFLVILSAYAYIRWTQRPTTRRALPWIGVTALLLHIQYQGLFIVAAQGLHALVFLRGAVRGRAVACMALIGGLFAPWFIAVAWQQRDNDTGIWAALPSNWNTVRELLHKFLSGQWALLGGLLLAGAAAWSPRVRWRPAGWTFFLFAWIGVTAIISFVLNLWFAVLAPHRILLIAPALAILIARGLANVPVAARRLLIGVILVYGVTTVDDYYPKEPWDEMAANMARYAEPGDMALLEVYRGDNPLTFYLDRLMPAGTPIESLRQWREFTPERYPAGILAVLSEADTVWLGHWSPDLSAFGFLEQTGHARTALMTTDHWGNALNVYRYDRIGGAAPLARFSSGMDLLRAEIDAAALRVDLWWRADAPLMQDYTVSAFLLDENGQLVAQHDSFPFENARPTSGWTPSEIVFDPHPLQPDDLPPGRYRAAVQVYTWFDGARFPLLDGEPWAVVGEVSRPPLN
jgi:hypothetical protein